VVINPRLGDSSWTWSKFLTWQWNQVFCFNTLLKVILVFVMYVAFWILEEQQQQRWIALIAFSLFFKELFPTWNTQSLDDFEDLQVIELKNEIRDIANNFDIKISKMKVIKELKR